MDLFWLSYFKHPSLLPHQSMGSHREQVKLRTGQGQKEGIIKLAHITNNIPAFFFVGALIVIIVFGTVNYL